MVNPSDPSSNASPQENPSLKAGLLALKQKKYQQAIAHLEIISQQKSLKQKLKAQMSLVVAYERTKQVDKAINLCRTLAENSHGEIRTWASHNLQELLKRYSRKNHQKSTITFPRTSDSSSTNQEHIETGFVPCNPTLDKSASAKNTNPSVKTGFEAFETKRNSSEINSTHASDFVSNTPANQNALDIAQNKLLDLSKSDDTLTDTTSDISHQTPQIKSRQAARAKGGRQLKSPNLILFLLEQIVAGVALFWLSLNILQFTIDTTNYSLVLLPYLRPIQILYRDPTRNFIIFIIVLFVFSPWLIDGLLMFGYGLQKLPTTTLINYSKEAHKLLGSFCQKQNIKRVILKVLPIDVPVAFSYGLLPRLLRFRIVVSQGLLEQLAEDEIATIYAREISHVDNRDFWLMSLVILMLQIPYTIYWQLTFWADWSLDFFEGRLSNFFPGFIKSLLHILVSGFRVLAAIISSLSYGLYWLLKLPILWFSRRRIYYSDRVSCNLTGNPNGLTRAILKITMAMADDVENQGKMRNLLESFELLMPVGINQAISIGSVISYSGFASIFNWDIVNPYRRWLQINNSHPLLGDRLQRLGTYASFWQLETELNLANVNVAKADNIPPLPYLNLQKLWLQGAPFFGMLLGLAFAMFLWLIGKISSAIGFWRLDWLWGDISILVGCLAIGSSIGILMRINHFFPDIKRTQLWQNPDLLELLTNQEALPLDSQPIQFKGQLIGKSGMSNWLGQDLILKTTKGLIKLHYSSQLGPIGNLWPQITRPSDFVGKSITVTGWWRRGATPWVDIDNLKSDHGKVINSSHPFWSTVLACTLAIWGVYYIVHIGRF